MSAITKESEPFEAASAALTQIIAIIRWLYHKMVILEKYLSGKYDNRPQKKFEEPMIMVPKFGFEAPILVKILFEKTLIASMPVH